MNKSYDNTVELIYNYMIDIDSFYSKLITNIDNIKNLNNLLKHLYNNKCNNNIYIYLIFLLYNDEISLSFINDNPNIISEDLENMVIKRIINQENNKNITKEIYIRDLILETYYGILSNKLVYKSIQTIIDICINIFSSFTSEEQNILKYLLDSMDENINDNEKIARLFLRINNKQCLIEKYSYLISYILNNDKYINNDKPFPLQTKDITNITENVDKLKNILNKFYNKLKYRTIYYESGEEVWQT